jgi:xylitol oxidase
VPEPSSRPTNWARNVTFGAVRFHRPGTVEEIRRIVAGADRVHVLGSGHSFSRVADTDGDLLRLDRLPRRIEVDREALTATVDGGATYIDVGPALQREGWALANLPSLPHLTVAGAVATGTHGSGGQLRCLSAGVAGLELVTGTGDVVQLGRGDDGFEGAVVALGALGVVTRLTLDLVPSFEVATTVVLDVPLDEVERAPEAVLDAAYSVSVFTDWHEITQVWVKSRTDELDVAPEEFFGARSATVPTHMISTADVENLTDQLGVPGEWHERLPHFRAGFTPSKGEELQSEYFVPRRHARAACDRLRELADAIAPLLLTCELRTVAGDDLWLSPASGGDVLALHFTWVPDEARVRALLPEIESALRPFGARPHWGKVFTTDARELERLYPRLPDFRDLVRQFDPRGAFTNDYLERTIAVSG